MLRQQDEPSRRQDSSAQSKVEHLEYLFNNTDRIIEYEQNS